MVEVQRVVRVELDRLTSLVNSFDEDADMEYIQQAYEQFVEALITGFYAFMFQGRVGAILELLVIV